MLYRQAPLRDVGKPRLRLALAGDAFKRSLAAAWAVVEPSLPGGAGGGEEADALVGVEEAKSPIASPTRPRAAKSPSRS